jgi:hypothetical protein
VVTESLQGNPPDKEILLSLGYPAKSSKICILEGSAEEKAEQLLTIFHNRSLLK